MKMPIELAEQHALKTLGEEQFNSNDFARTSIMSDFITGYEAAQPKWISFEKDAPYDGDYLCYLEQKQECGNVWDKQMVLQNTMNRFIIPSGWALTHWTPLLPSPSKIADNDNP